MMRRPVTLLTGLTIAFCAWSGCALAQAIPTISIAGNSSVSVAAGRVASSSFAVNVFQAGAPLANAHVTFTLPGTCGTFDGANVIDVVTDSSGRAAAPAFTASSFPNTCTASASIPNPILFGSSLSVPFTVYVYDPLSVRISADPSGAALMPGQAWQGSATLLDSGQRPIVGATLRFTSSSAACGKFGAALDTTAATDANGRAFVTGFNAGPAPVECALNVQWAEGGALLVVPVEVFTPAMANVATAPFAAIGYVNEGTWIMLQLRSPNGTPLANVPVTFDVAPGSNGASATLDRAGATTDSHGLANVLANGNGIPGSYSIRVGFSGASLDLPVTLAQRNTAKPVVPGGKYQDMWWGGDAQNGWGLSVIQHGDRLFAVMYAYNQIGEPLWFVFPGGSWDATHVYYSGTMFITYASPFFNYDVHQFHASANGFMTIAFLDDNHGEVLLDPSTPQTKSVWNITRQKFGAAATPMGDHTDMWWGGPTQNGWGLAVIQQNQSLFVVWFTYRSDGGETWYVAPAGSWVAPETWEAPVYRTTTGTFDMLGRSVYNPALLKVFAAGSLRLRFAGDTATLDYTVDGYSNSVALQRQGF